MLLNDIRYTTDVKSLNYSAINQNNKSKKAAALITNPKHTFQ